MKKIVKDRRCIDCNESISNRTKHAILCKECSRERQKGYLRKWQRAKREEKANIKSDKQIGYAIRELIHTTDALNWEEKEKEIKLFMKWFLQKEG